MKDEMKCKETSPSRLPLGVRWIIRLFGRKREPPSLVGAFLFGGRFLRRRGNEWQKNPFAA